MHTYTYILTNTERKGQRLAGREWIVQNTDAWRLKKGIQKKSISQEHNKNINFSRR